MAISITPFGILVLLLAIFVPPLAVLLEFGLGKDFLINVLLTILGYIPGHRYHFPSAPLSPRTTGAFAIRTAACSPPPAAAPSSPCVCPGIIHAVFLILTSPSNDVKVA